MDRELDYAECENCGKSLGTVLLDFQYEYFCSLKCNQEYNDDYDDDCDYEDDDFELLEYSE